VFPADPAKELLESRSNTRGTKLIKLNGCISSPLQGSTYIYEERGFSKPIIEYLLKPDTPLVHGRTNKINCDKLFGVQV
jgi:hypothetical protein